MSHVSIHALLAESDAWRALARAIEEFQSTPSLRRATSHLLHPYTAFVFQSTPSLRRATKDAMSYEGNYPVSIHALLAESDSAPTKTPRAPASFNPRPPCGERPSGTLSRPGRCTFQSTPSLRRATGAAGSRPHPEHVSIHALLAESDFPVVTQNTHNRGFNPRPPCGERLRHVGGP